MIVQAFCTVRQPTIAIFERNPYNPATAQP